MKRRVRIAVLIAVAVLAADWLIKHVLLDLLGIVPAVYNSTETTLWPLVIMVGCVAFLIWSKQSPAMAIWSGLLCGGVFANRVDRVLFGPVADYIPRPYTYPTIYFNLADVAICVGILGVVGCFVLGWWSEVARRGSRPDQTLP